MPFPKRDVKRMPRSRKLENLAMKNGWRHAIFNTAGDKYIGEWHENKMCGKGTLLSKNKEEIYEGDFKNNFRHGFGVLVHKLAKSNVFKLCYRGYWKNGKQHGEGLRIYTDNGFFMGNWKYGKRDGYGQMWYEDGSYFEGNWLKDLRHGKGFLVYENGNKYDGIWCDDMKHGKGMYYFLNVGHLQQGVWNRDVCISSTISGLPFRQTAIKPTIFPIPSNHLVNMKEIIESQETKALRGETENCLTSDKSSLTVSDTSKTKNYTIS